MLEREKKQKVNYTRDSVCPLGIICQCLETFVCQKWEDTIIIQWAEAGDAAKHPTISQNSIHNQELCGQGKQQCHC